MKRRLSGIAAVALLSIAMNVHGTQLTNQNFETGDLSGWTFWYSGWGQAVNSNFGAPALQGDYSALLVVRDTSAQPANCASFDPWGYTCPIPIPFTSAPHANAPLPGTMFPASGMDQALLSQQVELRAGDVISFDFQEFSNEGFTDSFFHFDSFGVSLVDEAYPIYYPRPESDHVLCGALGNIDTIVRCGGYPSTTVDFPTLLRPAAGRTTTGFSATGFEAWGDVYRWEVVAPYDGIWTLTVGVGSGGDTWISSGVLIDNFHIVPRQALPEPGSLSLLVLCLVGIGITHRKTRA